ncbi:MAG: hypothetical protein NT120_03410 [Candidatus Aenigmarchaeota archaeon]|nr:hypothetical protein [Candidatus Aenigmarchaeota archaeon]
MPKTRKEKWVRVCPKCNSKDVFLSIAGIIGGSQYKCGKCGFTGVVFPEISKK